MKKIGFMVFLMVALIMAVSVSSARAQDFYLKWDANGNDIVGEDPDDRHVVLSPGDTITVELYADSVPIDGLQGWQIGQVFSDTGMSYATNQLKALSCDIDTGVWNPSYSGCEIRESAGIINLYGALISTPYPTGKVHLATLKFECIGAGSETFDFTEVGSDYFKFLKAGNIQYNVNGEEYALTIENKIGPIKEVTPSNKDFGTVAIPGSSTQIFTVKNVGDPGSTLYICNVSVDTTPPFSIVSENCTTDPDGLAKDETCTIKVKFNCPDGSEGSYTGNLIIKHDDESTCTDPVMINEVPLKGRCSKFKAKQMIMPRIWPCTPPYHWWFESPDDPSSPTMTATPNEEVCFYVNYDALDDDGNRETELSGIGFWVEYDENFFNDPKVKHIFPKGYMNLEEPKIVDTGDWRKFLMAWADPGSPPAWPNEPLPLPLFKVCFIVKNNPHLAGLPTEIKFTKKDTTTGYDFYSESMEVKIVRFTIDIDKSGDVRPLTDGLLITRYLFGFRGNNLTSRAVDKVKGQRKDASDIADWIERGRVEPSTCGNQENRVHLDIDKNREVTALTDGIMILRYLFGYTGDNLKAGAIGPGADRTSPSDIANYINNCLMP